MDMQYVLRTWSVDCAFARSFCSAFFCHSMRIKINKRMKCHKHKNAKDTFR